MHRILLKYSASAPYDGIPCSASDLPLDDITCAGGLLIKELHRTAASTRKLSFSHSLEMILRVDKFRAEIVNPLEEQKRTTAVTSRKWKDHLQTLTESTVLRRARWSEIIHFSKYFAVPKMDEVTARAILNLRELSKLFKAPPPVNLPEIAEVLRGIAGGGLFWVVADWRHFFHQFRLIPGLWPFFGVQCGGDTYVWTTLAMGWSHSPRIAQCASWVIVLEACFRARLLDPASYTDLKNPPSYIRSAGIFIVIWYDNLLATFVKAEDRELFDTKVREVCGPAPKGFNCTWKHYNKYNLGAITTTMKSGWPVYLGMEFATRPAKATREEDSRREIVWRHETSRIVRWADARCPDPDTWTARKWARAVGIRLWDATISSRPLCLEQVVINILKKVGAETQGQGHGRWDKIPGFAWAEDTVSELKMLLDEVFDQNVWRTVRTTSDHCAVYSASDASGTIGYGGIEWLPDGRVQIIAQGIWESNCVGLQEAHIYIQEYFAATVTIERLCQKHRNITIRIAIDNTAVVHSLRALYSSNRHANELAMRVHKVLTQSDNRLDVVPVVSADNGADTVSRNEPLDANAIARCYEAIRSHEAGLGMCGKPESSPQFNGQMRHSEPPTDLLLDLDLETELWDNSIGSCHGDSMPSEPSIGANSCT